MGMVALIEAPLGTGRRRVLCGLHGLFKTGDGGVADDKMIAIGEIPGEPSCPEIRRVDNGLPRPLLIGWTQTDRPLARGFALTHPR